MEQLLSIGFLLSLILAETSATVTFTAPTVTSTDACTTLGSVAEGTTTGDVITAAATTDASSLVISLETNTANNFAIDAGTKVISIKSTADLDFEAGATVQVLVEGNDSGGTAVTATCVLTLTNVAPTVRSYASKTIVPSTAASGDAITSVTCSDGGGTISSYTISSGDDTSAKFAISNGGAITKTATAFDTTVSTSYVLVVKCDDGVSTASTTLTICLVSESNCHSSKASVNSGIMAVLVIPALVSIYYVMH